MLRRLLVGLLIGVVVGGLIAFGLVKGLGVLTFAGTGGAVLAYLFAAISGVLTGLIAGKPIWAQGGKVEAGLKAGFGALLAAGAMFALRRWVTAPLDLGGLGSAAIGELPVVTIPAVSTVLATLFELDNTGPSEKEKEDEAKQKARGGAAKSANGSTGARIATGDALDEDELDVPSKKAKR